MSANSKNFADVVKWIEDVIDSCETIEHTKTVNKLIINFQINYSEYYEFSRDLSIKLYDKIDLILNRKNLWQR